MKILTLLGIRPDIIRMFRLIRLLDDNQKKFNYQHVFSHTGQHFDFELDEIFYNELGVRKPEINLNIGRDLKAKGGPTSHAFQSAMLFERVYNLIEQERPNIVLYLGDTNSVLSSIVVARNNIPVVHIEAGGRSFDWRMPEEKNRIIIDHLSDALYCYMPRHRDILLSEGISGERIQVVGNIIYDAISEFLPKANNSKVLKEFGLKEKKYCLITLHREENISQQSSLQEKVSGLIRLSRDLPVIFPVMPRTMSHLERYNLISKLRDSKVIVTKPFGYLDFLKLESSAKLIISDSGTVQEEALILGVPALITRLSTERPETIVQKATILSNEDLFSNAKKAMKLKLDWDKDALNPAGKSPSDRIFSDLMRKIQSGYFQKSRLFKTIKHQDFVSESYGQIK